MIYWNIACLILKWGTATAHKKCHNILSFHPEGTQIRGRIIFCDPDSLWYWPRYKQEMGYHSHCYNKIIIMVLIDIYCGSLYIYTVHTNNSCMQVLIMTHGGLISHMYVGRMYTEWLIRIFSFRLHEPREDMPNRHNDIRSVVLWKHLETYTTSPMLSVYTVYTGVCNLMSCLVLMIEHPCRSIRDIAMIICVYTWNTWHNVILLKGWHSLA